MERQGNIAWALAWVSFGLCLSAKESVRYTGLWHFDEKPIFLVVAIGILYLFVYAGVMFLSKKRDVVLYRHKMTIIMLALLQTAGMILHTLRSSGVAIPEHLVFISFLGMEISVFLLLVIAQYHYSFDRQKIVNSFVYGIFVAGSMQIFLIFLNVAVARWLVSAFCLASAVTLYFSMANRAEDPTERDRMFVAGVRPWLREEAKDAKEPHRLRQSIWRIFLISLVLMGAYAQWQSQQDGGAASVLIQVFSGLGLILAAACLVVAQKYLRIRSLFFLCQTIVLPITLGALYLGTVFRGPVVSISLLLFDLAWGLILFSIWIAPLIYARTKVVYVLAAGFLAHKMGWAIGLAFTRSFPWQYHAWIGTVVVILAFVLLVVLSIMSLARSYRDTDEALSAKPEYGFESSCKIVGKRYALTTRENEILLLLAKGRTAPYLARDLFLSESTVRTHTAHIYRKMGINSQQELLDEIERTHMETLQADA
ncbi:MAG: helix-turn-helix transcriptional regulator [Coriobacteriia bacterium]|nr:helix-turn-helix transcriptional regulator [Coriobacteriia bacterium]